MITHTDASTIAPVSPTSPTPITVAHGDGIGPEIMDATSPHAARGGRGAGDRDDRDRRERVQRGNTAGIDAEAWESLRRTRVFLKAPITTPQGGGFKSLNVTMRKSLGPVRQCAPLRGLRALCRTPAIPAWMW